MRTTNRPTLVGTLCCFGILLCAIAIVVAGIQFVTNYHVKTIDEYVEDAAIIETFYTTDEDGYNSYYIMWENDHSTDIMKVCSTCYARYRDAEKMPLTVSVVESKFVKGYDFALHSHYNYERTDK